MGDHGLLFQKHRLEFGCLGHMISPLDRIPYTSVSNVPRSYVPIINSTLRTPNYNRKILLWDLFKTEFVDLGIGDVTDTQEGSDQRCHKLHDDK